MKIICKCEDCIHYVVCMHKETAKQIVEQCEGLKFKIEYRDNAVEIQYISPFDLKLECPYLRTEPIIDEGYMQ